MRPIDADALTYSYCPIAPILKGDKETWRFVLFDSDIDHAPTIDAAPVRRAHWIQEEYWSEGIGMGESHGHYYKCSACGKRVKLHDLYLDEYCRKCGAEMYEAKECERKRQEFDDMLAAKNNEWRQRNGQDDGER